VRLEESDTALTVIPHVSQDPAGGFFVADGRESQVRKYLEDGKLVWQTGGPGEGPGELRDPRVVLRLRDLGVVVAQYNRRITVFDSVGRSHVQTLSTSFRRLEDAAVIGRDSILVSAMTETDFEGPRLHILRLTTGQIEKSWFSPFVNSPVRDAAIMGGFSRLAVRGDTVAVAWSLADSVYLFDISGVRLDALPLRSSFFRVPAEQPPSGDAGVDHQQQWLSSFDYIAGIWWASPETLAIRYFELIPEESMARRWHLILFSPGSLRTIDIRNSPRLLSVDAATGRFVFSDPGTEESNQ
jgi:hypothetical protein